MDYWRNESNFGIFRMLYLIFRPLALLKNFPSNDLVLQQLPLEEVETFHGIFSLPFEYQGIDVDLIHLNLDIA